eukprot:scaffold42134_cov252-Amphora_coffeaeformis.AAC.4
MTHTKCSSSNGPNLNRSIVLNQLTSTCSHTVREEIEEYDSKRWEKDDKRNHAYREKRDQWEQTVKA